VIDQRDDGAVRWLTLRRPDRLNAFTGAMQHDLRIAVERAAQDAGVRAIVLTGEGRAFSVGADRSLLDGTADPADRELAGEEFPLLLEAVGTSPTPVLAAVNGLAVGLGATILLHCDVVLVGASARLRFPFTAMGIVPEAGSSALLPPNPRARWAMLSSEWIDADAAVAMDLALRAVPDEELVAEVRRSAEVLAALDPAGVAATKRLLIDGRTDAVRAAMAREHVEMGRLLRPSG
jgi:enoyl-CoA hydratase/carnithine racemase